MIRFKRILKEIHHESIKHAEELNLTQKEHDTIILKKKLKLENYNVWLHGKLIFRRRYREND